jgi:hypothetical protein
MIDRCRVYYSNNPTSFPTSGSNPELIVNGRSSLIYVSCSLVIPSTTSSGFVDNRCYFLCGSQDSSDIYFKFCPFYNSNKSTMIQFNFPIGGNGILFPNGIYIGKDANAPDGASTAQDFTYSLSLFYTGGVNA